MCDHIQINPKELEKGYFDKKYSREYSGGVIYRRAFLCDNFPVKKIYHVKAKTSLIEFRGVFFLIGIEISYKASAKTSPEGRQT